MSEQEWFEEWINNNYSEPEWNEGWNRFDMFEAWQASRQWTHVKKESPVHETLVLCKDKYGIPFIATYTPDGWKDKNNKEVYPVYWQHIPKLPEADQ